MAACSPAPLSTPSSAPQWFTKGVYYWRTGGSIVWSLWFSLPVIIGYQLTCSLNILHPFDWVYGVLLFAATLRCVVAMVTLCVSLALLSLLHSKMCTAVTLVHRTRLGIVCHVITPPRVVAIAAFGALGILGAWGLAVLTGAPHYQHLWHSMGDDYILNERLWFLILLGGYMGLWYGVCYISNKENNITFPIVQQKKIFRIRRNLWGLSKDSFIKSFKCLRVFLPVYYLTGSYPRQILINTFYLTQCGEEAQQLTSLWGLMDVCLLSQALLSTTALLLLWNNSLHLFKVFHTEGMVFPVIPLFTEDTGRAIVKCLAAKEVPLLQHLGYLDLYQLSLHSTERRKQVFSLNQSGKSAVWDELLSQCVALLNALTAKLRGQDTPPPPTATTDPTPTPTHTTEQFQKGWPEPVTIVTRRQVRNEKAKLWSTVSVPSGVQPVPLQTPQPAPMGQLFHSLYQQVAQFPNKVKDALKRKPLFSYFLAELPDTSLHAMFANAQLHIWAVRALSRLTISSYTEDHYGVVQRSLPVVMSTLVNLSQAVDKHTKGTLTVAGRNVQQASLRTVVLVGGRHSLKDALHSSLRHIASVFSREMMMFQLSDPQMRYLNSVVTSTRDGH